MTQAAMSSDRRVVRSDLWIDAVFDQRLKAEPGLSVGVFPVRGHPAAAWDTLSGAHVYHVSAAKDELPKEWFVRSELIERCPHLLCVSSSGAGYDTVDVAACTAAGIAVVNQSGGNAASVAEHTFGFILGLSRRMVEGDRRMRREIGYSREDVMGHEIQGKTLGLVGIGHIGRRVAALGKAYGMEVIATDPLLPAR
jgi:D-3-phosphoglycerate dehydrogenase